MPRRTAPESVPVMQVKDETGRLVRIPELVRRIVSLAPSNTETLFALGLGDRIVGDTDFCNYPAEAKQKRRIGGPINPNIEAIAALHPDLVVATREMNRLESVRALEQLGIAVYTTDAESVDQVLTSTQRLAELLGAAEKGRELVADLRGRLARVDQRIAGMVPKTAVMVVWLDPLVSVGRDTFLEDALRHAGVRSVIDAHQPWPTIDLEQVVRLQPEYLIISNENTGEVQREVAELQERPGWSRLAAVRNHRIIVVSEAINHPSPRLVDGIEQLAHALYPQQFAGEASIDYMAQNCRIHGSSLRPQSLSMSRIGGCA